MGHLIATRYAPSFVGYSERPDGWWRAVCGTWFQEGTPENRAADKYPYCEACYELRHAAHARAREGRDLLSLIREPDAGRGL